MMRQEGLGPLALSGMQDLRAATCPARKTKGQSLLRVGRLYHVGEFAALSGWRLRHSHMVLTSPNKLRTFTLFRS
jgi:hypothetical protein